MLRRRIICIALLGLAAFAAPVPLSAADAPAPPTLIVRLQSIDNVIAGVKYLAGVAGRADEAKRLDAQLKQVFPNGIQGIDSKRPLGLYASLDPNANLMESSGVLLVPVKDEKSFLGVLQKFNLKPMKEDDGAYSITPDNANVTIYLRFAHDYVYVTALHRAAVDKDKLIPPAKIFSESSSELVSASFRLDHIPDSIRQLILSQSDARMSALEDEKRAGETTAQRQIRLETAKATAGYLMNAIKEGGELGIRLDVNRNTGELAAELSVTGKPSSPFDAHLKAMGSAESLFAGLLKPDSAVNAVLHMTMPDNVRKALSSAVDEGIRSSLEKEKDATRRAQAEKLLKVLSPSLKSGDFDVAISLRGPGESNHYTLLAALKLKDGSEIDTVVRDLTKDLPEDAKRLIKLDAESAGDVKIHRLDVQQTFDPEAKKAFGDNPLYVALRSDALFVAAGEGGLSAVKEAIAARPGVAPPLEFDVSLSRLVPLMGKKGTSDPAAAARKVFADAKDKDKVHVKLEGGKALKLSVKMDAAVLKFISLTENRKAKD
jgi:hypothetical protein